MGVIGAAHIPLASVDLEGAAWSYLDGVFGAEEGKIRLLADGQDDVVAADRLFEAQTLDVLGHLAARNDVFDDRFTIDRHMHGFAYARIGQRLVARQVL